MRSGKGDRRTLTKEALTPGETPSFFRVDSIRPPAVDDVPISVTEIGAEARPMTSDRADLESLLAPKGRAHETADDWLLRLDGGLFAEAAPPLLAPLFDVEAPAPPAATLQAPPRTPSLVDPVPVVSERPPCGRRHSDIAGWIVGGAAATALIALIAWRLGRAPTGRDRATTAVAPLSPAAMAEPRPAAAEPSWPTRMTVSERARPTRPNGGSHAAAPLSTRSHKTVAAPRPLARPLAATSPAAPAPPPPTSASAEFDRAAARASLAAAAAAAASCMQPDDPARARVSIIFAPTGRVTMTRLVNGPFQGTPTGSCIARAFRTMSVPPFTGDPVTVTKDVFLR